MTPEASPALEVRGLHVEVRSGREMLSVVRDVSFTIRRGETLGVVGESGSGKTVTAQAIMRLLPSPPFHQAADQMALDGNDLLSASEAELRHWRGRELAMIFQDPMTALNPVFTIGDQIAEALLCHGMAGKAEARRRAVALLASVGVPEPELRALAYPFEFSGGMRQRAVIATAIACGPKLLIADEPTTALDVTVQAQIFALLGDIQRRTATAILLISHDLATISRIADRIMVMYGGRIMEQAPARSLVRSPRHPYTQALLRSAPHLAAGAPPRELPELPGTAPSAAELARLG
ncbi:MAG: ABC transporter ATP-binding protein, partial [Acetobacteraceae bacterium]